MDSPAPTNTLSLSLRAWPASNASANSLSSLIPRINEQRGHFRHVTEEGLLEEIKAAESSDDTTKLEETQEEGAGVDDTRSRKEELLLAREEIAKQIAQAYMEAYHALDFISLLLSKETPRVAEISLSPAVQQLVPLGCLGADKIAAPQLSPEELRGQELVSRGWKLQALETATESLSNSADRLEKEVESENRYWVQILAVRDKGWSVCRLPRERHTLGVRFGFGEAAAEFKERGLAALRRGEDGKIILDQGIASSQNKSVRVQMRRNGAITGTSTIPEVPKPEESDSVENLILQARNSLYEEELFYELSREARQLANQGVRTIDDTIILSLGDTAAQMLIDLVPVDEATGTESEYPSSLQHTDDDNDIAQGIALALRILLSYAHRVNLKRRSQPPPPIDRKRPIQPHSILHPILTHLFHQQALRALKSLLDSLVGPVVAAGLQANYTFDTYTNCATTSPIQPLAMTAAQKARSANMITPADAVVDRFKDRLESIATVYFPGCQTLTLEIHTSLHPPTLGTEYIIMTKHSSPSTAPSSIGEETHKNSQHQPLPLPPPRVRFNSVNETALHLSWTLSRSIVQEIRSFTPPPPSGPLTAAGTTTTTTTTTPPGDIPGEAGWEPLGGQQGTTTELQKNFPQRAQIRRMKIEAAPGRLTLRWGETNGKAGWKVHVWEEEGGVRGGEPKSKLVDVVRDAGNWSNKAPLLIRRHDDDEELLSSSPIR
ncbi:hypothetical protein GP486_001436 [Trichoglossum hirsutum]|uniref:Mediator of RNA polymerase II transcription subunit 17 n=1 Tax=Trichoglossum hirsutum TaxID=265104 RepID=A0A9P8RT19_9PEZI|nr:hypothetical protein GP486_001436 [Trichoglossum hirsutum]